MTDQEILREALDIARAELARYTEMLNRGGSGDPRPRIKHLGVVCAGMDRLLREHHEAYR